MVAANGNMSAVGVSLFRADKADHFGIGDLLAMVVRKYFVENDLEGVGALDMLNCVGGVGVYALEEATKFVVVQMTPDLFLIWMVVELVMLEVMASGYIKDREVPVIDETRRLLVACS